MAWKDDNDTTVGGRVGERADGGLRGTRIAGQQAYTGETVDRMLAATGSRAAVFEGEMMVSSGFDQNSQEDQSLFMHEWGHKELGWGEGGAQAMELATMVFQKMDNFEFTIERGIDMVSKMKGISDTQMSGEAVVKMVAGEGRPREDEANPMTGYFGMLQQGWSEKDVVGMLGKWAQKTMEKQEQVTRERTGQDQ